MHLNHGVRMVKVVSGDGSVPAPAPVPGAEAEEPPGPLLPMTYHVCQVPHYTL